ncbi:MAG: molybdopterin-dependent oxidoreductase, partial [Sutterellaceae bacterium]|nr:molybdopterin-dependent oxidoreductase [Sutterellaceae bacterium]
MLNRRDLFKVAGAATLSGVVPASQAVAQSAGKVKATPANVAKTYQGGVTAGPVLKGQGDLSLSKTFNLGKSVLNDGEVMNASHWGVYKAHIKGGKIERLEPVGEDNAPSMQLQAVAQQPYNNARIRYPMVRLSYLKKGYKAGGKKRGAEPFVRVSWDKALELVASELKRVRDTYGPS